ncbi:sialate O-acetylesterase [Spirosoma sp.]|uniref:sialate O-acetylesterase n=1 Tax=Spirosoma sp. TaxID=1899569 RepID=UPI0026306668|nr:sialate O-acetylesterase [Spirosoma sp.]MCX6215724.1 T9SS type A sorting domain-containing protein [Spirosoma sp.]
MNRLYIGVILFLYYFQAQGQLVFERLPRELQLYPRDANNQAEVIVSGKMDTPGYTKITMRMAREGVLTQVVSQSLEPSSSNAPFSLSTIIKAEPAEYSFQVYLFKGQDSLLVANSQRIVCGDVYIIHGQSNALALSNFDELYSFNFNDKYMRNVAYPYLGLPTQMSWYPAKQPFASVGGLGLTLQRLILENYGIPTCVINGAMGGTPISALSVRDPLNHANPITFYGDLLNRAQWAGIAKQTKAIIWKQGEEDAGSGLPGYPAKFTTLYNQFREDYGNARIYVGQINILNNPQDSAAALRDFQRRTKYIFNNVETIATVGTPGYDGVHYSGLAHQRMAFEQFRLIARDIYGSKDTLQINSPDIKKVFYNTRKDSITLVFDDQMQMVWKNDTTFYNFATGAKIAFREQKDFFYLDRQSGLVTGGSANGNRVILSLKQPTSAKTIRYLPAYFSDAVSPFYDGPTLRNTRGMRAFSFDNVAIADAIPAVTTLAAKPISEKQIQLSWAVLPTTQNQILERAIGTPTNFTPLANLGGTVGAYNDTNVPDMFGTYYYRLRAFSAVSESAYSNVVSARPLVLGTEPNEPLVKIYPNPVASDRVLYVEADQALFTELTVRDLLGRAVKTWRGTPKKVVSLALDNLEAGLYVTDIQTVNGHLIRQKLIIR